MGSEASADDLVAPLANGVTHTLTRERLVSLYRAHQPPSTDRAVRQTNKIANTLTQSRSTTDTPTPLSEPSVRENLLHRLAALVPDGGGNTTSGANRQVRHSGVFTATKVSGQTRRGNGPFTHLSRGYA